MRPKCLTLIGKFLTAGMDDPQHCFSLSHVRHNGGQEMANIRKRGERWQVQIRRAGLKPISRTFAYHKDAQAWARDQERRCDIGLHPVDPETKLNITVGDLLERYVREITPQKKSAKNEKFMIRAIMRDGICMEKALNVGSSKFASYRDGRLKMVAPATVRRELGVFSHSFNLARMEWGYPSIKNPLKDVRYPSGSSARERRLVRGEYEKLRDHAQCSRATYLWPLVRLAIETGMRRSELLALKWENIDLKSRLASLYGTKNGDNRTIPLTEEAAAVLSGMIRESSRVFPITSAAVRHSWERLTKRAGIVDLHFHDLRHEAISRFFEKGLSVPEVALISGHKTPSQLFRYTQMTAEHVLTKLN
jgi:integrase